MKSRISKLFSVDAVYAMAHGVHNVIEEECVNNMGTLHYLCEQLQPAPEGPRLLQHLRNVSFIGEREAGLFGTIFPNLLMPLTLRN